MDTRYLQLTPAVLLVGQSSWTGLPTRGGVDAILYILITIGSVVVTRYWLPAVIPIPRTKKDRDAIYGAVHVAHGLDARSGHIRTVQEAVGGGAVFGGIVAGLIGLLSPGIFWLLALTGPPVAGWLNWTFSPKARALRDNIVAEQNAELEKERQREEEARRTKRQGEQVRDSIWSGMVMDACFWWTSEGKLLHEDLEYLRRFVRANLGIVGNSKNILSRYHDITQPLAVPSRRTEIAAWMLEHHPDVLAERLPKEPPQTVPELANKLRLYFEREALVLREATAFNLAQTVNPPKEESLTERVKRYIDETHGVVAATEANIEYVKQQASVLYPNDPDKQEEFISDQTELVNDLGRTEMRRYAGAPS